MASLGTSPRTPIGKGRQYSSRQEEALSPPTTSSSSGSTIEHDRPFQPYAHRKTLKNTLSLSDCLHPLYRATREGGPGPASQPSRGLTIFDRVENRDGAEYEEDDRDDVDEDEHNRRTHRPTTAPRQDWHATTNQRWQSIRNTLEARRQIEEARENVRREAGIGNTRTFSRRSGSPPSRVVRNDRDREDNLPVRLETGYRDREASRSKQVQRPLSKRGSRQVVIKVDGPNRGDRKGNLRQGFRGELLDHWDRQEEDPSLDVEGKMRDIPKGPRPMPPLAKADAEQEITFEEDVLDSAEEPRAEHRSAQVGNEGERPRRREQPKRVMPKKLFG
ncbi:MAG: hypothetical protein Q9213_007074 [Squamulea squamosa]